ncbi:hypothetical protein AYO21_08653 [Fonsecaea monophora]|uniref:Uncharacterized protein n=1 Tax=Fonsecaea monophora TaxID=254056 RepID=A0A177EYS2_9EURO|nr:hypothetical protein AYO21_08653 [Fonsecaea monophora]KAH0845327.1 hypothetical protein FOPE_12006 [Fonsecaea pedrosoi]OAG37118.1 hypothetical protein AYO21_08653 [Fonsecaea monophora]
MSSQVSESLPFYFVDKLSNMRVRLPINQTTSWTQFLACLSDVSGPVAAQIKNFSVSTYVSRTPQAPQGFTVRDGPWLLREVTSALRGAEEHASYSKWRVISRKLFLRLRNQSLESGTSVEILHTLQHVRNQGVARGSEQPPIWGIPFNAAARGFTPATGFGPGPFPALYRASGPTIPYEGWHDYPRNNPPARMSAQGQYQGEHPYGPMRNSVGIPPAYGPAPAQHHAPYQPYSSSAAAHYYLGPGFSQGIQRPTYPMHQQGQILTPRLGLHPHPRPNHYPPSFSAPFQPSIPALAPSQTHIAAAPVPFPSPGFVQVPTPAAPRSPPPSTPTDLVSWTSDMYPRLVVDSADIHWLHREQILREQVKFGQAPVVKAMDVWAEKSKPRY